MKKNICYLLALFFLLSMNDAKALEPIGGVANQGYDAGAFNKMERQTLSVCHERTERKDDRRSAGG